jgi:hypothetical protein
MAKKKFYAYKIDGEQGITASWDECSALTASRALSTKVSKATTRWKYGSPLEARYKKLKGRCLSKPIFCIPAAPRRLRAKNSPCGKKNSILPNKSTNYGKIQNNTGQLFGAYQGG